jgi:hypothetical protein
MSSLEKIQRTEWGESASSVFLVADAQIGSADYVVIKSPATGVAEKRSLLCNIRYCMIHYENL